MRDGEGEAGSGALPCHLEGMRALPKTLRLTLADTRADEYYIDSRNPVAARVRSLTMRLMALRERSDGLTYTHRQR